MPVLSFDLDWQQWLFVLSNLAIVGGYGFIAFRVAPLFPVRAVARYGAFAFFVLCASTHADQIYHTLTDRHEEWGWIASSLHMLVIHIPQSFAVWVFAIGFMIDLRRLRRERHTTDPATQ